MMTRSAFGAMASIGAMVAAGLLVQACGDDTGGRPAGHDGAVVLDAPRAQDRDESVDVASVLPDAPRAQDQGEPVDVDPVVPDAPVGQDQVAPVDLSSSAEAGAAMDGPATANEAGAGIDTLAAIATPTELVDQIRQIYCADIDRCCGTSATVVKGLQGGCGATDWAPVIATLQAALSQGATWDGVAAAGCLAGLTQKLAGPCEGPPLANRTVAEVILRIRGSSIAACKTFISAGEKGIGAECGGHLECMAGLQCVTDLAPSVCAPLREADDNCGGDVLCNFDGLYCDDGGTGTCRAVTTNGASCTSDVQCADGVCAGLPKVCTAVCR